MSGEQVEIDYVLNISMGDFTYTDLRRIEMSFIRIGGELRKVFGDSAASKAIADMERMIMLARQAQMAIRAVEMASGPIGWVYAATTIVAVGFATYDTMQGMSL